MRNITVLIDGNHKDLYLSENINVTPDSKIFVKYATVFWDYNNVNDTIVYDGTIYRFCDGYWTYEKLSRLKDNYILYNESSKLYQLLNRVYMVMNASGGTNILCGKPTNLKKFGKLIGFNENTTIQQGIQTISPNPVDLNRGLKYVTVSCDIVNEMQNVNTDGKRSYSYVVATLSVPRDIDLKRSITQYNNSDNRILVRGGCYSKLSFDVNTNIGDVNIGSILLIGTNDR